MEAKFVGSKYNEQLSTTEIAKRVRSEIRDAVKAGELPKAKYSVRSEYFAGGSSIDVKVTEVPFTVRNPNYNHMSSDPAERCWMTPEASTLEDKLEAMLNAYNFDNSDSQTDYFHVKFYGHVKIEG